jgi:hypothetical protein
MSGLPERAFGAVLVMHVGSKPMSSTGVSVRVPCPMHVEGQAVDQHLRETDEAFMRDSFAVEMPGEATDLGSS